MLNSDKNILLIDWLDVYGGAERVVKYLDEIYHFDKVYTLVNVMPNEALDRMFSNKNLIIKTSFLQFFGKHFRYTLPLFPVALKSIKINDKNALIISVTHSVVKGVEVSNESLHISYLVSRNLKYVWEEKDLYFKGFKKFFTFIISPLRKFDIKSANRPNSLVAVSNFVAKWAIEKYKKEVTVIYAPVNIDDFELQEKKEDFYVSVGRLEPYKRYDLLIDVFNKNGKKLIIIGDGSLMSTLKAKANKNIQFKGYLFADKSKAFLKNAKAFIFCGKEDFGIALLEPQACGTPVIAFGEGGALETVIENKTGVFFYKQTSDDLLATIEKFEALSFEASFIRTHAEKFSIQNFKQQFIELVNFQKNSFFKTN
ncbi:MAG: glycosyltransferase family 4 protein [Flavobacteriales bacterium]|nr:glycosyltransferase family 4 protein [Flavobacteriales bacterium]